MSVYRKFDESVFLKSGRVKNMNTGVSANFANAANSPKNIRDSAASGLAARCYSITNPGVESPGYRKFDPNSVKLVEPAVKRTANQLAQSQPIDLPNGKADERAAIDAPTSETIAADWSRAIGVPIEWVVGYRSMLGGVPRSIPELRWTRLTVSVAVIFERWARQAVALGWDELDLFGCFSQAPVRRIDHCGLAWFIEHDSELLAITAMTARFRTSTGAVQSVTRKLKKEPGGVPVWEISKSQPASAHGSQQARDGDQT
jgi:hypothetical protein